MKFNVLSPTGKGLFSQEEELTKWEYRKRPARSSFRETRIYAFDCQSPPSRGTDNDKQKNPLKKDGLPKKEPDKKTPSTSPPVERR